MRTKEDIIHALEDGADYICLAGDVVDKAPEQGYEALKEYIDFVHNYQGCQSSNNHGGYSGYQAKMRKGVVFYGDFLEKGLGFRPRLISLL